MPRRRPVARKNAVATRTREQVAHMFHNAIEQLEPRTLFNTIGLNQTDGTFEYKDGRNNIVRVAFHNIVAELVFARVDANTNEVVLSNATPSFSMEDGKDLFTIYVAQAGADAWISIAEVPAVTATNRPMQPYNGSVSLNVFTINGLAGVSTAGGSGSIYLGARTRDTPANIPNEPDRPILTDQFFGLGILGPRPNGRLTAGVIVESGVDLKKFFFGGTISGQVTLGGSIDTFYCGALLTGDTRGDGSGAVSIPNNFLVNGDMRELIVMGSIGTHDDANQGDPEYLSGFDMQVNGTIGRVQSYGSIIGDIRALNDPNAPRLRGRQSEVESKVLPGNRGSLTMFQGTDERDFDFGDPNAIGEPRLGDNQAEFNNDTFDTAQLLGVFDSNTAGQNVVDLNGRLQHIPRIGDPADFYAIPLLAGQTINIKLTAPQSTFGIPGLPDIPGAFLTVLDPDGRVIASDNNKIAPDETLNRVFQITADRPGIYRLAVNIASASLRINLPYQLRVQNLGEMSIGAIAASNDIFFSTFAADQSLATFHAFNGDLGAVSAGAAIASDFAFEDMVVDGGNLRAIDGAQLGYRIDGVLGNGPTLHVLGGSVGHIRGRNSIVVMENAEIEDGAKGVGGDLQLIEAPNDTLFMQLNADGALGVVRAANMATEPAASVINVNADGVGADGIIDLIDVTGNLGTLAAGGPAITTGPGGNVRYIHVGGQAFRDVFFGGGEPDVANFAVGEKVHFVDDSGTVMEFTPTRGQQIVNPDGTITIINGGALSTVRYGIRDKGGAVLITLGSTRGVTIAAGGQNPRGTAEIGTINVQGNGTAIIDDPGFTPTNFLDDVLELDTTGTTGANARNQALEVIFTGNAMTDVYEITFGGTAVNAGRFTKIINETGGEIVNLLANSVGELVAGSLGIARSSTGTLVAGNTILNIPIAQVGPDPDAGPFLQQRTAIRINGDLISARSLYGMGNFVVTGTIQELVANADGKPVAGVHEGINAPILTQPGGVVTGGGGGIREINIGEGILPVGTGEVLRSGIYAHGRIGLIFNQGLGSDIRGAIVSKGQNLPTVTRTLPNGTIDVTVAAPIGTIALTDGSLLGAQIFVVQRFQNARQINGGTVVASDVGGISSEPVFEIETVHLKGRGGMMGTSILAADIGDVVVENGFGMINSVVRSLAQHEVDNIVVDGYGIRSSAYLGGGSINQINARGNGTKLSTLDYTPTVRFSERLGFDPYTGQPLSGLNDLHVFLGTTAAAPVRTTGSVSTSGLISDFAAVGSRDLNLVVANRIENSAFNFATSTNQMIVRDYMDTVLITSGRLNFLQTGSDVFNSAFNIAGPVGVVGIGGTFRGTSTLSATGPNGQIGTFATGRALFGSVVTTNNADLIRVGTDFGAPGSFNEDGDRISAGIDIGRNLGQFIVRGSMLDGSTAWVGNNLGFLQVGGDIQEDALLSVKTLSSQDIGGEVFGEVEIRANG